MGDGQMMSELYQENMKRQDNGRTRRPSSASMGAVLPSALHLNGIFS